MLPSYTGLQADLAYLYAAIMMALSRTIAIARPSRARPIGHNRAISREHAVLITRLADSSLRELAVFEGSCKLAPDLLWCGPLWDSPTFMLALLLGIVRQCFLTKLRSEHDGYQSISSLY